MSDGTDTDLSFKQPAPKFSADKKKKGKAWSEKARRKTAENDDNYDQKGTEQEQKDSEKKDSPKKKPEKPKQPEKEPEKSQENNDNDEEKKLTKKIKTKAYEWSS